MITKVKAFEYTVQHENGANFKAFRNGEYWKDLTGDNLILALCQRIEDLEQELTNIRGFHKVNDN